MTLIDTNRLVIRDITEQDFHFIFRLLNEPSWIKYIGDKGIKTETDAKNYIQTGPLQMYKDFGFGLFLVTLKENAIPIGLCGLIKRPSLENIDLGYAFLPEYTGKGYAFEATKAVIKYGKEQLSIDKIVAITTIDNLNSEKVLLKLGFSFDSLIIENNASEELKLFTKVL
jgi:[ribosomal protein S5]-alanine N-acetyltransferase